MIAPDTGHLAPPVPQPKRPTRVDWRRVTELLAEGNSTAEVAAAVGCSRQTVWNVLRKSRAMEDTLYDAESEIGTNANLRLRGLRPKVADALAREVDKGNVRVMLWLPRRSGRTGQSKKVMSVPGEASPSA